MTRPVQSDRGGATLLQQSTAMALSVPVALVVCVFTLGCARPESDGLEDPSPIETMAMRHAPSNSVVESQSRGRNVYDHYCAICHAADGKGDGFNSANLAVPPRDFSNPKFWRQATDERLLLTVSQGGPAVGKSVLMQPWGRTLTDRQMRDVVAYLHTLVAQE